LPESISSRPALPTDLLTAISFAESIDHFGPLEALVVPAMVLRLAIVQPK